MRRRSTYREDYASHDAGSSTESYEDLKSKLEQANRQIDYLKSKAENANREIDDLKSKVAFLQFSPSPDPSSFPRFPDVALIASHDASDPTDLSLRDPIRAHKDVLAERSPVFRAMFENQMEESLSGTINISDASHDALRAFVSYLYTAEACLDDQMACDLLVMAEKYQVNNLKAYCEKFIKSNSNRGN